MNKKNQVLFRILSALFVWGLLFGLSACSEPKLQNSQPVNSSTQQGASSQPQQESSFSSGDPATVEETSSGTKILIAYFTAAENSGPDVDAVTTASYSTINGTAVGRLRAIANMIAAETGGQLFSIQTSVIYSSDIGELIDYAAKEQAENARPELTNHIESLEDYDTIFVGYPNWWADLPQALYSFFDEYDFSGKTIVPFNVHNGSQLSRTVETIKELEPGATVEEDAFTISEHAMENASEEVSAWLDRLEY